MHQQDQSQRDVNVGRRQREPQQTSGQPTLPRHNPGRPEQHGREQEQAEETSQQLRPGNHGRSEGGHQKNMGVGDAVRL